MPSESRITTLMSCSMRTTVMPESRISRMSWASTADSYGLAPAAGSSRSSNRGFGGKRAGDLETALRAVGQLPGQGVRLRRQADPLEERHAGALRLKLLAPG